MRLRTGSQSRWAAAALVAMAAVVLLAGVRPGTARAAGPRLDHRLGAITSPADEGLASAPKGVVRVRMAVAPAARVTWVRVNGVAVRRTVVRQGRNALVDLRLRRPLRFGVNVVVARLTAPGRVGFARARFTLVRPVTGIVSVAAPAPNARLGAAPLPLRLRARPGSTVRVWLNGVAADGAVRAGRPGTWSGVLSPAEGLRHGPNELRVRVVDPSGRIQSVRRRVSVTRAGPLASAGVERRTTAGLAIRLDGRASAPVPDAGALTYSWRIVRAPRGSRPTLTGATTARPVITTDRPGSYVVRNTVTSPRPGGAPATSTDTATVAASAPGPLVPLVSGTGTGGGPGITLGDTFIAAGVSGPGVQVLVLDRETLEVLPASAAYPAGSMDDLLSDLTAAGAAGTQPLAVLSSLPGGAPTSGAADVTDLADALALIGISSATRTVTGAGPFSAVGTLQAAPTASGATQSPVPVDGYLTVDVNGNYAFDFGDYVPFTSEPAPGGGNTITVGTGTWSVPAPPSGQGGFQLVTLDPQTLAGTSTWFATNVGKPVSFGGGPGPICGVGPAPPCPQQTTVPEQEALTQLAAALGAARAAGQIVILSGVCTPSQPSSTTPCSPLTSAPSVLAPQINGVIAQIAALGGTADVVAGLAASDTYSFAGPTPPGQNPAESSSVITSGSDGGLSGVLARNADGTFAVQLADVTGTLEFGSIDLQAVAFAPATPWPYSSTPAQAAVLQYISANVVEGGLGCDAAGQCDVRNAYGDVGIDMSNYSDDLQRLAWPRGGITGATERDFTDVKNQLLAEFPLVGSVWELIAALQYPYTLGASGGQVELSQVISAIDAAIAPTTNTAVTNGLSYAMDVLWAASLIEFPVGDGLIETWLGYATVGAAFGANLADTAGGAPVAQIKAEGTQLQSAWLTQSESVSLGIGNLGAIAVSDWGKLQTVAAAWDDGGFDNQVQAQLLGLVQDGARQTFAQALMPTAYASWQLPYSDPGAPPWGLVAGTLSCSNTETMWQPFDGISQTGQVLLATGISGIDANTSAPVFSQPGFYALLEAGYDANNDANAFSDGKVPPASLTDALFQSPLAEGASTYAAGLYPPWFWNRVYVPSATSLWCPLPQP